MPPDQSALSVSKSKSWEPPNPEDMFHCRSFSHLCLAKGLGLRLAQSRPYWKKDVIGHLLVSQSSWKMQLSVQERNKMTSPSHAGGCESNGGEVFLMDLMVSIFLMI